MKFLVCTSHRGAHRSGFCDLSLLAFVAVAMLVPRSSPAQQKNDFAGDYAGTLNGLHVKLHITVSADGTVSANVDSPDQNMFALACSDIGINGQTLSFTVPNVRGEWMGTLSADRTSLSGIWKHRPPDATELYEEWRGALGQQRRTGHCSDTGGTCSECG